MTKALIPQIFGLLNSEGSNRSRGGEEGLAQDAAQPLEFIAGGRNDGLDHDPDPSGTRPSNEQDCMPF